ncbi:MAG: hypothetical protein ACTSPV_05240 [Candidatus Hodarchaeales archaeon]
MDYLDLILKLTYPIVVLITLLLSAYKIDPKKKYRNVIVKILTDVKEVTPDNVDVVIDLIIKGLQAEGLNPESKVAKELTNEVAKCALSKKKKK